MIEDILFGKLSNKKWVKSLFEASDSVIEIENKLQNGELQNNEPVQDFLSELQNTLLYQESETEMILLTGPEYNIKFETLDISSMDFDDFQNYVLKTMRNFFNNFPRTKNPIFVHIFGPDINQTYAKYARFRAYKRLIINKQNGKTKLDCIVCYATYKYKYYITNWQTYNPHFNKYIYKRLEVTKTGTNGRRYNWYLSPLFFEKMKNLIYLPVEKPTIINTNDEQTLIQPTKPVKKEKPSLQKYNAEIVDNADEINYDDVKMHIMSKKNTDGILPYILTADVITDEGARTYMNVCNMVENNVVNINDKLLDNKLKQALKYNYKNIPDINTDTEYNGTISVSDKEKIVADRNLIKFTQSSEERTKVRRMSIKVCDVYLQAMKNAKHRDFESDYKFSEHLNYSLHNYLVEILSPLAVVANSNMCTWMEDVKGTGLTAFKEHVNVPTSSTNFIDSAYISFPKISNFPLADSVIYINGIRTYLSTKGGFDGKGSNASIKTLREFVYGKDGKTLTYLADGLKKDSSIKNEYAVFEELLKGNIKYLDWSKIQKYTGYSRLSELQEWINDRMSIFTHIIMTILQAQSFQFMQVMCEATNEKQNKKEGDFHFKYKIQYPAVFNGNVQILLPTGDSNSIRFHIE